jgi:hypothetical protein
VPITHGMFEQSLYPLDDLRLLALFSTRTSAEFIEYSLTSSLPDHRASDRLNSNGRVKACANKTAEAYRCRRGSIWRLIAETVVDALFEVQASVALCIPEIPFSLFLTNDLSRLESSGPGSPMSGHAPRVGDRNDNMSQYG